MIFPISIWPALQPLDLYALFAPTVLNGGILGFRVYLFFIPSMWLICDSKRTLTKIVLFFNTKPDWDSWIKRDQLDVTCFIISSCNSNMFRMLIHPSSGACELFVELFHGLYCSGTSSLSLFIHLSRWCTVQ